MPSNPDNPFEQQLSDQLLQARMKLLGYNRNGPGVGYQGPPDVGLEEPPEAKFMRLMGNVAGGYTIGKGLLNMAGPSNFQPSGSMPSLQPSQQMIQLSSQMPYPQGASSPLTNALMNVKLSGKIPYQAGVSEEFGANNLMPWINKVLAPGSMSGMAEKRAAIDTLSQLKNSASQNTGLMKMAQMVGF